MSYDKNFVPFEEAKKLKELGFDWECSRYYIDSLPNSYPNRDGQTINWNSPHTKTISAPLYSQAFAWLRGDISGWVYQNWIETDAYEWSFEIRYLPFEAKRLKRPVSAVVRIDSFECFPPTYSGAWQTYEEAEFKLLQRMLELYPKTQQPIAND